MTARQTSARRKSGAPHAPPVGAFHDAAAPPAPRVLATALGGAAPLWRRFARDVREACGPLVDQWSFSKAFGWTLRLKQPTRVLVYLTPCESHFLASFALGEKACAAIRRASVPAGMLVIIDAAPRYAEGRGVRIPVRSRADLAGVLALARIKAHVPRA